jgi:hypothetical protein
MGHGGGSIGTEGGVSGNKRNDICWNYALEAIIKMLLL